MYADSQKNPDLGKIEIMGGAQVTAQGGEKGAGIGGGWLAKSGNTNAKTNIKIRGAKTVVNATGGAGAAGIGSGFNAFVTGTSAGDIRSAESALIDLYGGTIMATGGSFTEDGTTYAGASIGGGASKRPP